MAGRPAVSLRRHRRLRDYHCPSIRPKPRGLANAEENKSTSPVRLRDRRSHPNRSGSSRRRSPAPGRPTGCCRASLEPFPDANARERAGRGGGRTFMRVYVAALLLAAVCTFAVAGDSAPALIFRLYEGRNINSFTRDGDVAAHLLLRSGEHPRILVAFPAGNSGVGLWFE